jgi:hypothetical protein
MEHLDPPDPRVWDERRLWFEGLEAEWAEHGGAVFSEQAAALIIDLQAAFCAGSWAAVVILGGAIVETQTEASKRHPASAEELRWLRALRNRLLHENRGEPVLTIEQQWTGRRLWEDHARRAVRLVFEAMYGGGDQTR